MIGEREYEVGALLRNPIPDIAKTDNLKEIIEVAFENGWERPSLAQKKTLKSAKKALGKEDYATAIELGKQASANSETKDNPDVYVILGQANMYLFNGDMTQLPLAQEAFDNFQTAIEKGGDKVKDKLMEEVVLNAENVRLGGGEGLMFLQNMLNRQGNVYFEAEDYEKSYEYFLISSNIQPDDIIMVFYVGYSAYGASKDEEALTSYKKVIELNEAFAAQGLASLRALGLADDAPHVNPNGGAIALGHPLGMSGARLVLTAAYQLKRTGGRYALCTMCVGVGQGVALILERI